MRSLAGHVLIVLALGGSMAFSAGLARYLGGLRLAPTVWLVVMGAACWTTTEALSLFGALGWTGSAAGATAMALLASAPVARGALRDGVRRVREALRGRAAAASAIATILGVTLFVALVAPPNTWDALTYHNPRVLHWLDRGSVGHYETSIDRQLRMPPLAAYFRLHLFALTASDRLFNGVQWVFFAASIVQSAALGWAATRSGAVAMAAAGFVATAPLAILEASSSQNDLVAAGYVLAAAVAGAEAVQSRHLRPALVLLACAAVGLGAAVKGTVWVIGPLLLAATAAAGVAAVRIERTDVDPRRPGRPWFDERRAWLLGLALASLFVAPHALRNRARFGDALPHPEAVPLSAWADRGGARLLSQLWRGALLQVQPLFTREVSAAPLVAANEAFHRALGVDAADAAITWTADVPFLRRTSPLHEDTTGNPVHFGMAVGATLLTLLLPRLRRDRMAAALLAIAWTAWLASVASVRWMPWGARLQLPALLLFAVPVARVVVGAKDQSERRALAFTLALAALSIPWLLFNASRPLVARRGSPSILERSRWENLFRNRPELQTEVERIGAMLPADCSPERPIGLAIGGNQWEYALWLGAARAGRRVPLRHLPPGDGGGSWCAVVSDECPRARLCLRGAS